MKNQTYEFQLIFTSFIINQKEKSNFQFVSYVFILVIKCSNLIVSRPECKNLKTVNYRMLVCLILDLNTCFFKSVVIYVNHPEPAN